MSTGLFWFTLFHTALSLVMLAAGFVVVCAMLKARSPDGWTALYVATAVLTSVTGFMFPVDKFLPSHAVGIISLVVLVLVILGRYVYHFAGAWRWIYAVAAVIALYFDAFVGVVQSFLKIPFFNVLAPTQGEPPFAIAQGIVLVIFVVLGYLAAKRFHPAQI